MYLKKFTVIAVTAGVIAGLAACGGSNGSSGTTNSKSVTGPITSFGSVYVNGVEYDTSGATVYIEDSESSESELKVGMTVTVTTSSAGVADSVHFDDDVEGIVTDATIDPATETGTLEVLGQTVTVDANTIFESHVGTITLPSEIAKGNIVEVSGSSSGTGDIVATRLEVKALDMAAYKSAGKAIEVKGIVANHDDVAETFKIGKQVVDYAAAILEMPAGNWDGLYVEVKSTAGIDAGTGFLVASKVELEDGGSKGHDGDENDEIEVKGVVSDMVADTSVTVNGQTFLLNASTQYEHGVAAELVVGAMVEVEGKFNANGELVAFKLEFEDDEADDEIKGIVAAVNATAPNEGTIDVGGMVIVISASTIMHDSSAMHVANFNLTMLKGGDTVEVDYITNPDGTYTAIKLEREVAAP